METITKDNYKIYFKSSEDMSELKDNSISLTVTSPPYFSMRGMMEYDSYNTYLKIMFNVLKENFRVTQEGRVSVWNVGDYMDYDEDGEFVKYPCPADIILLGRKAGFRYIDDILWKKSDGCKGGGSGKRFGTFIQHPYPMRYYPNTIYEHMIIFRKGSAIKHPKEDKMDIKKYMRFSNDVWEFSPDIRNQYKEEYNHGAQFPIILPETFIRLYSFKGENVLDCFAGSCTSILAAIRNGRNGIGYEINPGHKRVIDYKLGFMNKSLSAFTAKNTSSNSKPREEGNTSINT